ncbi:DUF2795 domain-containing protein [Nocardiopsis alkaliphila]|uniref:DUF2795 domain-containing protein n=1 Tax=Nocardiopsis alkaliphila TaxID=225762 RepID=UPI0003495CE6|nr:DUF2795 domain-containing protein [Nocardiopsis alkaliphila]
MGVERGREGLRRILEGVRFPVSRDAVVEAALESGADQELVSALRAMPAAEFNEENAILRAVPLPEDEPDSNTEAARAREHGR